MKFRRAAQFVFVLLHFTWAASERASAIGPPAPRRPSISSSPPIEAHVTAAAAATTTTTTSRHRGLQEAPNSSSNATTISEVVPTRRKLATRSLENGLLKLPQSAQQLQRQTQATSTANQAPSVQLQLAVRQQLANVNSSCPPSEPSSLGGATGQQDNSSAFILNAQQKGVSFGFSQPKVSEFVKPNFYTLRLKLDPNKRKFSGQLMVSVDLNYGTGRQRQQSPSASNASAGVRYLTLHSGSNISIKKAFYVFTSRGNIQIPATKIGRNLDQELMTLDFHPNVIPVPSQGLLLLVYSGLVNDTDSHGLFVHRHNHSSGHYHSARPPKSSSNSIADSSQLVTTGLATHMEPSFARRLFPSWDEPQLKARFSLIVVLPFRGYETLSNTPVKRKSISLSCSGDSLQEVEFHTTPTMSTYLLTLVIGKFEHIESITPNNCKIRAYFYANQTLGPPQGQPSGNSTSADGPADYAPPSGVNQRRQAAQMALDFAVKTFDYLESELGVKYPLSKFDMIALRDFNSGGMENWGASVFHENYLLCDNNNQNANIRVNGGANRPKRLVVPLVVAHEIVHQWFGNLLTSRSWTFLWLNEGFAQLLMYEVAQAVYPQENYWHIFLEDNRKSAMHEDELITSSRALEWGDELELDLEDQLSLFDQLTYNKGAMLLRMVQFALGPREFVAGLRHYLLKHSYGSVCSHDLWAALEESSTGRMLDKQLESLMDGWLKQEGFPLVTVRVSDSQDDLHYKLELQQERFTLLPAEAAIWRPDSSAQATNQTLDQSVSTGNSSSSGQPWSTWLWSIPLTISSELRPEPSTDELRLWPQQHDSSRVGSSSSSSSRLFGRHSSSILFNDKSTALLVPKASVGNWLKLNYNAIGYFRVDYTTDSPSEHQAPNQALDLLARMRPSIRDQTMGPFDRFNLLDDLFSLVLSGRKSLVYYLRFLEEAYDQEDELLVLRFVFESLDRIRSAIVSNWQPVQTRAFGTASAAAAAASQQKLETAFECYVQRLARKLIGAFKMRQQQKRPMSHQQQSSLTSDQHSQHSTGNNDNSAELQELLDSIRLAYAAASCNSAQVGPATQTAGEDNEAAQLRQWAVDSFARHFRSSVSPMNSQTGANQKSPLELAGRELRAAIYSAALNHKQQAPGATRQQLSRPMASARSKNSRRRSLPQNSPTPIQTTASGGSNEFRDYVTSTNKQSGLLWQQFRWHQLQQLAMNLTQPEVGVFFKLLAAYESNYELGASASERSVLAQALGTTRNFTEQLLLLNLTLGQGFFRAQDAALMLDSLAQTNSGRQLIWLQLTEQSRAFKQRQLLSAALKSVSRGLIEREASALQTQSDHSNSNQQQQQQQQQSVEHQLRQLYVSYGSSEHGKLIGQSIEWVRINTLWFKRDHESLAEFLGDN